MSFDANRFAAPGATSSQVSQLQASLNYIEATSPTGTSILSQMQSEGIKVQMETNGTNFFDPNTGYVNYDPNVAIVTFDASGHSVSAESPAMGLIHEGDHALNTNLANDVNTSDAQYTNAAEARAVGTEDQAASEMHEAGRDNHYGKEVVVGDPTEHVAVDPNTGQSNWVTADGATHGDFQPGQASNDIPGAAPGTFPQESPPVNPDAYDPREFDSSGTDYNQGWADDGGYGGGGGGYGHWDPDGPPMQAEGVHVSDGSEDGSAPSPQVRGYIRGTAGDDTIISAVGGDTLQGAGGSNTFVFQRYDTSSAQSPDLILDFDPSTDKIDLRGLHLSSSDHVSQTVSNGFDVLTVSGGDGSVNLKITLVGAHEVPLSDILT